MRTQYENEDTLRAETELKERIEHVWKCALHKLPAFYQVDFVATSNEDDSFIIGWLEVKCRSHALAKYPTVLLAASKWLKLVELARDTGLPSFFVAAFTDAVLYLDVGKAIEAKGLFRYRWGGRTVNKRDDQDVEPVVHIPIALMTRIE
jgi:hypothetical protein